ncbi:UDP-N-acetylglucosamine 2-epimerase (non-hydrolyzing) [Patescibacteria group bacterium]|nr:MAG: UDP-N-acetylglucosamine 2-epimerase (non-hydrolyzing) [Patescibacteria group bacterium]
MKHIALLAGARPNFMKIAPLRAALVNRGARATLIHTGQHYDPLMSDVFFRDLGLPEPDINLGVGAGDRVEQMGSIVSALVPALKERSPEALVVVGDITSTVAGAMFGMLAGIPVAHVEAGLRSFHWPMPEELNRMFTDHHSRWLFVTEPAGVRNLQEERVPAERIHFVGNVMIDTLRRFERQAASSDILVRLGLQPKSYAVLTLHRPESVDRPETFLALAATLAEASTRLPLIYPVHHRVRGRLTGTPLATASGVRIIEPLGYVDMLALVRDATAVLTDSGGLQEETTALGVPCITLRGQTERPITVEVGTSEVVGHDRLAILDAVDRVLAGKWKKGSVPWLWDGRAAERIADILIAA